MGIIKTALEIAMEKTEAVKGDRLEIEQFEAKQKGKKTANAFLAGNIDLAAEIKKPGKNLKDSFKRGIFDVLVSQIALPSDKNDEKKIEAVGKGLQLLIEDKSFSLMYKQLTELFAQYLQEVVQYEQQIRQQYAPKLRQKEEEISQRLGREIRIDPMQDPEFVAFYNQHINALKKNYEALIEQAKAEAKRMFAPAD